MGCEQSCRHVCYGTKKRKALLMNWNLKLLLPDADLSDNTHRCFVTNSIAIKWLFHSNFSLSLICKQALESRVHSGGHACHIWSGCEADV